MSEKVRSHFGGAFGKDLPLHFWRGQLRPLAGFAGVQWAFRVTRLETDPATAHALLVEIAPEVPREARALYDGAARLLLSYLGASENGLHEPRPVA